MIARVGSTRAIEGSSTNTTYLITDGEDEGGEGGNKNKIERDKVERKHTWKSPLGSLFVYPGPLVIASMHTPCSLTSLNGDSL